MIEALVPVAGEVRRLTGQLFETLVADGSRNVVCSGLGLWCALGVLTAGSEGETADELSSVLGVSPSQAPALLAAVDQRLLATGGAAHALAMWSRIPVYREFRSSFPMVGFGQLGDDTDLDAWTSEHTNGMIDTFPVVITDATLLALADAIALWAKWETPFLVDQTVDRPFRLPTGEIRVATMQRRSSAWDVTVLGQTTRYDLACGSAVVPGGTDAPPPRRAPIVRFGLGEPGLSPDATMAAVLSDASGERPKADFVDVHLPRFALENSHDLVEPLRELGVVRAVGDEAEFPRLSPEPLKIGEARQSAVIEVDEIGVKAAAVTAFAMRAGAMFLPDPVVMDLRFDRPFGFALIDPELDLPLFAGWVADPRG